MQPTIVDLSHWQASVDFTKLKAAGILAVILKATEGASYVDPTYADRKKAAAVAGLTCLSYHFLKPGDVPTQVKHYLATVKPVPGERLVCDYEDQGVRLTDLRAFCKSLQDAGGNYQVTVYGGALLKEQLGSTVDAYLAANTSLWLAQYTNGTPSWPTATWPAWSLWQFTDKATVSGVSGGVDGNVFNGSDENAMKFLQPAGGAVPTPAPTPAPGPTAETNLIFTIEADGPVNVAIKAGNSVKVFLA